MLAQNKFYYNIIIVLHLIIFAFALIKGFLQNCRNMVAKSGEMLYITHVGHFPDAIRLERYRRGHNEPHSKCGRQETGARVRIPFSPPTKRTSIFACPFCFSVLNKRNSARCVASCRLRREPLRRKAGAPLLRVNSPTSLLHEPFLSAIKKQRNSYLLLHKASYIDSVAYKTVKVGDKIYITNN